MAVDGTMLYVKIEKKFTFVNRQSFNILRASLQTDAEQNDEHRNVIKLLLFQFSPQRREVVSRFSSASVCKQLLGAEPYMRNICFAPGIT